MELTTLLISSGQLSANPRLIKEAIALYQAGYRVIVLYCPLSPWADELDHDLMQKHPDITWQRVGWHPVKNRWFYRYARLRAKWYHCLWSLLGNVCDAAIRSEALFTQELEQAACKIKADLYSGHNLGALPAVVKAAAQWQAKAVFDFEDYHRGEHPNDSARQKKVRQVEKTYAPQLHAATSAAPLITELYKNHFPELQVITVNNCFPLSYATDALELIPAKPLRLFWFSQFIGKKRGLEEVIEALGRLEQGSVRLTLLGNCSEEMRNYFLRCACKAGLLEDQLVFVAPVSEAEIVRIASQHHLGLASEIPHIHNRDLCLTNKLFIYLLAGNAILASDTKAQQRFLEENPGVGVVYPSHNSLELSEILQHYIDNPNLLTEHREKSRNLATVLNWDKEQMVLLNLIRSLLHLS